MKKKKTKKRSKPTDETTCSKSLAWSQAWLRSLGILMVFWNLRTEDQSNGPLKSASEKHEGKKWHTDWWNPGSDAPRDPGDPRWPGSRLLEKRSYRADSCELNSPQSFIVVCSVWKVQKQPPAEPRGPRTTSGQPLLPSRLSPPCIIWIEQSCSQYTVGFSYTKTQVEKCKK